MTWKRSYRDRTEDNQGRTQVTPEQDRSQSRSYRSWVGQDEEHSRSSHLALGKSDLLTWRWAGQTFSPGAREVRSAHLALGRSDLLTWRWAGQICSPGAGQVRSSHLAVGRSDLLTWR